jgi:hypothetical protein
MVEAPAVVFNGAVYVLASIVVTHQTGQHGYRETGYAEMLRLTPAGWTEAGRSPGGLKSQLQLTRVRGAIFAAGSSCPSVCLGWGFPGRTALLRPGSDRSVARLRPPSGVPYPWNFAAGAQAIVVTYTDGLGTRDPGRITPLPGTCDIYDVATGAWQPGPTIPAMARVAGPAYWTPYGVIMIGESLVGNIPAASAGRMIPADAHTGGWLLRPSGHRTGSSSQPGST